VLIKGYAVPYPPGCLSEPDSLELKRCSRMVLDLADLFGAEHHFERLRVIRANVILVVEESLRQQRRSDQNSPVTFQFLLNGFHEFQQRIGLKMLDDVREQDEVKSSLAIQGFGRPAIQSIGLMQPDELRIEVHACDFHPGMVKRDQKAPFPAAIIEDPEAARRVFRAQLANPREDFEFLLVHRG
jgi:hypothetical protein